MISCNKLLPKPTVPAQEHLNLPSCCVLESPPPSPFPSFVLFARLLATRSPEFTSLLLHLPFYLLSF